MFARTRTLLFFVLVGSVFFAIAGCGGSSDVPSVFDDGGAEGSTGDSSVPATDGSAPPTFGDGSMQDGTKVFEACTGASCFDGPVCGDGVVEAGETCDDGNTVPGDGCSGVCQVEPGWSCPTPDSRA